MKGFKLSNFGVDELRSLAVRNELKVEKKRKKDELITFLKEELPKLPNVILTPPFLAAKALKYFEKGKLVFVTLSEGSELEIIEYHQELIVIQGENHYILPSERPLGVEEFFWNLRYLLTELIGVNPDSKRFLQKPPALVDGTEVKDFLSINSEVLEPLFFYQVLPDMSCQQVNFGEVFGATESKEEKRSPKKSLTEEFQNLNLEEKRETKRPKNSLEQGSSKEVLTTAKKRRVVIIEEEKRVLPPKKEVTASVIVLEPEKKVQGKPAKLSEDSWKLLQSFAYVPHETEKKALGASCLSVVATESKWGLTQHLPSQKEEKEPDWQEKFGMTKTDLLKDYEASLKRYENQVDADGCIVRNPLTKEDSFLYQYSLCSRYLRDKERPELTPGTSSEELQTLVSTYYRESVTHGVCCLVLLQTGMAKLRNKQELLIDRDIRSETFVYVLEARTPWKGKERVLKVGYSAVSVESRLKSLKTGCPFPLEVLTWYRASQEAETKLHEKLSKYSSGGGDEWFQVPEEVVSKLLALGDEAVRSKMKLEDLVARTQF